MQNENSFKENLIDIAKKCYLKCCLLTRNINIRKFPKLPQKNNKRILIISSDNNKRSGAFLCMSSLCDYLINKYGLDVFVILPNFGDGKPFLDEKNIPNYLINSFGWGIELSRKRDDKCEKEINNKKLVNEAAINKLRNIIRDNDFDLVHINSSYSYVGAIAAQKENIPFVWHIREFLEDDQNNTMWDRKKGNDLINQSDKVIAISNSVYNKYSSVVDSDKLIVIYDGIETEKFYKPQKEILNDEIIKFIFIGNIAEYKGIFDFSEACIKLYKSGFGNFEVLIVGAGDDKVVSTIKDNFIKAKLNDKVKFYGYQKDVAPFLCKSDVFCMCSRSEAFGRTTVEAMLSGNLVIGANSAGTADLIDDGETGILYKQGDSNDLFEKMKFVINNNIKSKEIAKAGQKYMFQNMSSEMNADKIYNLYEEIFDKY